MSESAIRAAAKSVLESVDVIGVVHDRRRFSKSPGELLRKCKNNRGVVSSWEIHREACPAQWANNAEAERSHAYRIYGTYGLDDENNSDAEFQALIEAVFAAFLADPTLGGTALDTDPLFVDDIDFGEEFGSGRTYHTCELLLTARERQS